MNQFLRRLTCIEKRVGDLERATETGADQITQISSNYTVAVTDSTIVADTSGGPFTITLPDATSNAGHRLTFKRIPDDGDPATIVPSGPDTIDGESSMMLSNDYSSLSFRAAQGQWLVTASYNN